MNKILVISALIGFMVYACDEAESTNVVDSSAGCNNGICMEEFMDDTISRSEIDSAIVDGLLFLREEEKLARDVYLYMSELWGTRVFSNIAQSEQRHTDAVLNLLELYEIEDIVGDNPQGVFVNSELQELYNKLIEQGKNSEIDALKVGALIEEVDIIDLAEVMDNLSIEAIYTVYNNLLKGSYNHLNAFVRNLDKRGIDYSPQLLSEEEYNQIVN